MNIETLQQNPELAKHITLQIKGSELISFAEKVADNTAKEIQAILKEKNKPDTLLTRAEVKEKLNVTYPTLWRWEQKEVLTPIRIGSRIRYRLSDIEKVLNSK